MIPYCKARGIGLIPWSPLQGGTLARPINQSTARAEMFKNTPLGTNSSEADNTVVNRVEELSKKRGWKMSQVALAWIGTKVDSPIIGANSVSSSFPEL